MENLLKERFGGEIRIKQRDSRFETDPVMHSLEKYELLANGMIVGYLYEFAQMVDIDPRIFKEKGLPGYLKKQVVGKVDKGLYMGVGRELSFVSLLGGKSLDQTTGSGFEKEQPRNEAKNNSYQESSLVGGGRHNLPHRPARWE